MPQPRALQACSACKRLKRGCDKRLPSCRPCIQAGRRCDYSASSRPPPTASDLDALQDRIIKLEEQLAKVGGTSVPATATETPHSEAPGHAPEQRELVSTQFPPALFLDLDSFIWSGARLPTPQIEIPLDVLAVLTRGNTIVDICDEYFSTIHLWWPIMSKMRLDTGISVINSGPDMAMLFLSMKLITSPPTDLTINCLYTVAKSYLSKLVAAGVVSHCYLQALLLISLYEYSHAIYPAAWLTIGECARYTSLLGLSPAAANTSWTKSPTTWTEIEERRRIWWGVYILDRVSCLGSKRPPGLVDVPENAILPNDDKGWDEGDISTAASQPVTLTANSSQSAFNHLCKAAILTNNAIKSTWSPTLPQQAALTDELLTFISGIDAIIAPSQLSSSSSSPAPLPWLPAISLARSALYIVLDPLSCPEKLLTTSPGITLAGQPKSADELAMQGRAMALVRNVSREAREIVGGLLVQVTVERGGSDGDDDGEDSDVAGGQEEEGEGEGERDGEARREMSELGRISPLCLDMAYAALATYHWLAGEGRRGMYEVETGELGAFLEKMGKRWRVGREYAGIAGMWDVIARAGRVS